MIAKCIIVTKKLLSKQKSIEFDNQLIEIPEILKKETKKIKKLEKKDSKLTGKKRHSTISSSPKPGNEIKSRIRSYFDLYKYQKKFIEEHSLLDNYEILLDE